MRLASRSKPCQDQSNLEPQMAYSLLTAHPNPRYGSYRGVETLSSPMLYRADQLLNIIDIPIELLNFIVSELSGRDLGNFRLCSRKCARIGIHFLASNGFSVLNTSRCLNDFRALLGCEIIARSTKEITFLHGQWPVCSRIEWEVNTILLGERCLPAFGSRTNAGYQSLCPKALDEAFSAYNAFITEEQRRLSCNDVACLIDTLKLLPNLDKITVSSVYDLISHPTQNLKYFNLQQSIWLSPYTIDLVDFATQSILLALNGLPNIHRLIIHGMLDPERLNIDWSITLPSIKTLQLNALHILGNQGAVQDFFLAFPNLVDLSVNFKGYGPTGIELLHWDRLERLHFGEIWATEQEIFSVFQHNQDTLRYFCLSNPVLIRGSWRSLFTRIRTLKAVSMVTGDGELRQRGKDSIKMTLAGRERLAEFMNNSLAPWPFEARAANLSFLYTDT